jgi:hypothetical protein
MTTEAAERSETQQQALVAIPPALALVRDGVEQWLPAPGDAIVGGAAADSLALGRAPAGRRGLGSGVGLELRSAIMQPADVLTVWMRGGSIYAEQLVVGEARTLAVRGVDGRPRLSAGSYVVNASNGARMMLAGIDVLDGDPAINCGSAELWLEDVLVQPGLGDGLQRPLDSPDFPDSQENLGHFLPRRWDRPLLCSMSRTVRWRVGRWGHRNGQGTLVDAEGVSSAGLVADGKKPFPRQLVFFGEPFEICAVAVVEVVHQREDDIR